MKAVTPAGASIVTPWVIVTGPYPPESSTMTSPSGFSCGTAPAKVWHGVAMLSQALALFPERAETKTRLASARAGEMERTQTPRPAKMRRVFTNFSLGVAGRASDRRERADDAVRRRGAVARDCVVPARLDR